MARLSPEERRHTFDEVELGLPEAAAIREVRRCLRCDWELQKQLKLKEADAQKPQSEAERVPVQAG